MIIESNRSANNSDTEYAEQMLEASFNIGTVAWKAFSESPFGNTVFLLLPSDEAKQYAEDLFLDGFVKRMTFLMPIGEPVLDRMCEEHLADFVWQYYLQTAQGRIILDGDAYPDTPKPVLGAAKLFFKIGFKSGSLAYNELFTS